MHKRERIRAIGGALLLTAFTLAGCTSDGHFNFLGYSTEPLYDKTIHTVYVPMATNVTFRRGLEDYLTRAVIREINTKTTFRTVPRPDGADTELDLKIITWRKNTVIPSPTYGPRQAELGLGIEVFWKDLRPGKLGDVLSNAKPTISQEAPLPGIASPPPPRPLPVLLLPVANYEPELGPSNASAEKQVIDRVAVRIVSMMEKPW